jgi:hypothetical protein
VIGTLAAECHDDDSALTRAVAAKPRVAAVLQVTCGKRIVVKRHTSVE